MPPGQRLSARLAELGWTQLRLATEIGADTSLVCRWISGDRVPTLDMAFAIERSPVAVPADAWLEALSARAG
jgi:transcriptional regulator with XRE-family HTH domain